MVSGNSHPVLSGRVKGTVIYAKTLLAVAGFSATEGLNDKGVNGKRSSD